MGTQARAKKVVAKKAAKRKSARPARIAKALLDAIPDTSAPAPEPSHTLSPEKERALAAYIDTGTVRGAMQTVQMARRTWYDWRDNDPLFRAASDAVADEVADDLEQEAIKRAKAGSDVLLIFLLKSHRPEKYRERFEHTGKDGKPIQHTVTVKQTWKVGAREVSWN